MRQGSRRQMRIIHRGISKAALGHHTKAIIDYNTAIKLNPDDALTFTHRGIAKATLGQYTAPSEYHTRFEWIIAMLYAIPARL